MASKPRDKSQLRRLLASYGTVLRWLGRIEILLTASMVFFMIAAIAVEVYFRYGIGSSLFWVEEGATICFIWITLIGAAIASKAGRHINLVALGYLLSPRGQIVLVVFGHAAVTALALIIAYYAWGYTALQGRTFTVSLPYNIPRSWMFSWPLLFAMVSIALSHIYYFLDNVRNLAESSAPKESAVLMEI